MTLRLGEMLIAKNLLNKEQLHAALLKQAETGKVLGEILIGMGLVDEKSLLTVLAEQFNTRFVELENVQINPLIAKMVPQDLVTEYRFMPIEMRNAVILIAVSNPLDMWPMSVLQKQLRLSDVQIVLAKKTDIENFIRKYYQA